MKVSVYEMVMPREPAMKSMTRHDNNDLRDIAGRYGHSKSVVPESFSQSVLDHFIDYRFHGHHHGVGYWYYGTGDFQHRGLPTYLMSKITDPSDLKIASKWVNRFEWQEPLHGLFNLWIRRTRELRWIRKRGSKWRKKRVLQLWAETAPGLETSLGPPGKEVHKLTKTNL